MAEYTRIMREEGMSVGMGSRSVAKLTISWVRNNFSKRRAGT
jgi:hypothetical protein